MNMNPEQSPLGVAIVRFKAARRAHTARKQLERARIVATLTTDAEGTLLSVDREDVYRVIHVLGDIDAPQNTRDDRRWDDDGGALEYRASALRT